MTDRVAIFYMIASFLSAFASILALGLTRIADNPQVDGWKWIFIVEGAFTLGIAIWTWFGMLDFPDVEMRKLKFLSSEEAEIIKSWILSESGSLEGEKVTWAAIKDVMSDWRIYTV